MRDPTASWRNLARLDRWAKGNLKNVRMSRSRNKSCGVYKVAPPARMHKIFTQVTLRTLARVLLRRFMRRVSQIGEDVAALCYQRVSPRPSTRWNFFPTRNLPATMRLATGLACRASRPVCLLPYRTLFLNAELLPSALSRFPISFRPVPFVPSHLPSFRVLRLLSYVLLSCSVIIYPGNIVLPLLGPPLLTREKYNIWEEKVSKKSM